VHLAGREIGLNERLRGFASAGWFSACGLPLEPSDFSGAKFYLAALGVHPSVRVEPVASWEHAERIIRNPAWDMSWWEREESERKALFQLCIQRVGEPEAVETLSLAVGVEHQIIHAAATTAASRLGVTDLSIVGAASGAASMAAHGRALALLAEVGDEHVFVRKYSLFEGGRWPLGLVNGAFHLF